MEIKRSGAQLPPHRHMHFGADQPTRHETDFNATPVSAWRWPFVIAIAALASHGAYLKLQSKRPPRNNREPRPTTGVDGHNVVALKSQAN